MKIAYLNVYFDPESAHGGHAHIYQFIRCATQQGHEVWTWPNDHPDAIDLPRARLGKARVLRSCDAILFRVEGGPPALFKLFRPFYRWTLGRARIVWEFNTVPEFGRIVGQSEAQINGFLDTFRRYAPYCDLAVCVSDRLADYVRDKIGVRRVVTIPNGSDTEMFRPGLQPHAYLRGHEGLNVVWMGSAGLGWADFELIRESARILWEERLARSIRIFVLGASFSGLRDMTPNVIYLGKDIYENIPGWLAGMQIGLISYTPGPSDYNSPLKLFDYLASGLAVISTAQPQAASILNEMGFGEFVVEPNDANGLVDRLLRLARDPELLRRYQATCRAAAIRQYTWSHTVTRVFQEIGNLAGNK